jgi:predicted nucleic acid-binding Zn ribbon protein
MNNRKVYRKVQKQCEMCDHKMTFLVQQNVIKDDYDTLLDIYSRILNKDKRRARQHALKMSGMILTIVATILVLNVVIAYVWEKHGPMPFVVAGIVIAALVGALAPAKKNPGDGANALLNKLEGWQDYERYGKNPIYFR